MVFVIAAFVAGLLTLLELDKTFYLPQAGPGRTKLRSWIALFVVANAVIAILTAVILRSNNDFKNLHWALQGAAAGLAYMAAVRIKFATLPLGQETFQFGFEALYDSAKGYVYKRINALAKAARRVEVDALIAANSLEKLVVKAREEVLYDELLDEVGKRQRQEWILDVADSPHTSNIEKERFLANFICSGRQFSRFHSDDTQP